MSQQALALASGVRYGTVSHAERGHHQTRTTTIYKLATALGVTVSSLTDPVDVSVDSADAPVPGRLVLDLHPVAIEYLARLHATGLWGSTIEDVARTLLLSALRSEVSR